MSRLIRNNEKIVNKTFLQLMEKLGYDVELTYVKKENWTMFDPVAKQIRHDTVFPKKIKRAYEMGAELLRRIN